MRYNIGQTLFAAHFVFASHNDCGNLLYTKPLLFSNEQPLQINFAKLEVTEHHKVRNSYDDESKVPEYDGYVLKDSNGVEFHNQYPTASYGQTTDTGNRRFTLGSTASEFESFKGDHSKFVEAHLFTEVLSDIAEGIARLSEVQLTDKNAPAARAKVEELKVLQERIHKEFKEQFPEYHISTMEKTLWPGASIKHFVSTVYRKIKVEELTALPVDQLIAQFKGDELLHVVFPSGDFLILDQQIGNYLLWSELNPHSRAGLKTDVEHISLYYVENPEPAGSGGYVHQTEYFHPKDVREAVEAMLRRALGKSPLRATSGSSLEVIFAKESLAQALFGPGTYEVNLLADGKEVVTYSSKGDIFKLTYDKDLDIYQLVTLPREQDQVFASILPTEISAEIAVAVYKKLVEAAMVAAGENEFGIAPESITQAVRAALADKMPKQ